MNDSPYASDALTSQIVSVIQAASDYTGSERGGAGIGARVRRALLQDSLALPLLALAVLTVLIVSPRAEFPLNDDWVYGESVRRFLNTGHLSSHPFSGSVLVAQMVWGAIFCRALGFSFTALRISTLVLSYANAWATARAARVCGLGRGAALVCGALVFTSPIALSLSYSFMTDVPSLSVTTLSGLCYLYAFKKPSVAAVLSGSVLGVLACLIRESGVVFPLAFVGVTLIFVMRGAYAIPRRTVVAFVGTWLVGAGLVAWALASKDPGLVRPSAPAAPVMTRLIETLRYGAMALCYLGFFVLPLGAARVWTLVCEPQTLKRSLRWTAPLVYSAGIMLLLCLHGIRRLPELGIGNMLYDLGVGPMTLSDAYWGHPTWMPVKIGIAWWPIMITSVLTGGFLLDSGVNAIRAAFRRTDPSDPDPGAARQGAFLVLWAVVTVGCLWNPLLNKVFDRYFLVGLTPCALLLARDTLRSPSKGTIRVAWMGCGLVYAFSLVSLHDYLAWNQARWTAIHQLQDQRHVGAEAIDGGFEFNGMFTSDEYMRRHQTRNFFESGKVGYWIIDDEYIVGMSGQRAGYEVISRTPYMSWLAAREREILVFHRVGGGTPALDG